MAKPKFSLTEGMIGGINKNTQKVSKLKAKENFNLNYIDINDIIVNKRNFYEISDIDELAEDIQLNGLNHNLVVRPYDDKFEIISGERRYTALKKLVDNGDDRFKLVPCKITNLNDLDAEIVLIQANAQSRELTESDRLTQIERLTELYTIKKNNGEKIGTIRKQISKDTGLSETQVGRYSTINKGLIPELKELLGQGDLNIANASEFAKLSEESQVQILEIVKNKININKNEAVELKKQFKKIEDEKEELLEKEKKYKHTIKNLNKENEEITNKIDEQIEKIKLELTKENNNKNKEKLETLEKEKLKLRNEKEELLKKLNESNNIDKIIKEKTKEITSNFEEEKLKIQKENKNSKIKLKETQEKDKNVELHEELKLRLKSIRKDMNKVTSLLSNNTIIDEPITKEIENLKVELNFLNEQIQLYSNQEKI